MRQKSGSIVGASMLPKKPLSITKELLALPHTIRYGDHRGHLVDQSQAGRTCRAHDYCADPMVPGAPFPVCVKHLRECYEFAQDYIEERWDDGVRKYIADSVPIVSKPPTVVTRRTKREGHVYFVRFRDSVKAAAGDSAYRGHWCYQG